MNVWACLDENHNVVATSDMQRVEAMLKSDTERRVGLDKVGGYEISTVFLGLDHGYNGVPMWFETMTFGDGTLNGNCERCTTWDDAVEMHQRHVEIARAFASVIGKIEREAHPHARLGFIETTKFGDTEPTFVEVELREHQKEKPDMSEAHELTDEEWNTPL